MSFEFNLEDIHFHIDLLEVINFKPDLKHSDFLEEDLDLWRDGQLSFFQLIITSSKNEEERQHYVPAILLPLNNEEELQQRIEVFLDGPAGLDKILLHWEEDTSHSPEWAK